jgi:hypothetical protein
VITAFVLTWYLIKRDIPYVPIPSLVRILGFSNSSAWNYLPHILDICQYNRSGQPNGEYCGDNDENVITTYPSFDEEPGVQPQKNNENNDGNEDGIDDYQGRSSCRWIIVVCRWKA